MRTDLTLTRLAALAAVTALLAVGLACNETDDPAQAEAVILVDSISTAGLSADPAAPDTTAVVAYTVHPRNDLASTFFHDVTLNSYTVGFEPAIITSMAGAISTGYCPAALGTCSVVLTLVPAGAKPASGTSVVAHVAVEGRDVNDNPVNFTVNVALTFTP